MFLPTAKMAKVLAAFEKKRNVYWINFRFLSNSCLMFTSRGPQRPIFLYEILKSPDFRNIFPDFWYDFPISCWFLYDFFWELISKVISWFLVCFLGFYCDFLISNWFLWFHVFFRFLIALASSDECFDRVYHRSTLRAINTTSTNKHFNASESFLNFCTARAWHQ